MSLCKSEEDATSTTSTTLGKRSVPKSAKKSPSKKKTKLTGASSRSPRKAKKVSSSKRRADKATNKSKRKNSKPKQKKRSRSKPRMRKDKDEKKKSEPKKKTKSQKKKKKSKLKAVSAKILKNRQNDGSRKLKEFKEKPIYVIDEHDGTMVCALRAIETGHVPGRNVKLMHFDSHPDLGCILETWDNVDSIYNGDYDIKDLYDETDIATWITPMALAGHCPFVMWACGHWCDQFPVGCWDLLVGKDKNDNTVKVGSRGNKKMACLDYWESGGSVCKEEDFEYCREWTLMVVRYGKNCELPQKQYDRVMKEFGDGSPWILDIDEDFFSCNNPYFDEFRDLFGEDIHEVVKEIYDVSPDTQTDLEDELMSMYQDQRYCKPWSKFVKSKLAKDLLKAMQCTSKKATLKKFHKFLRKHWPNGGGFEEDVSEEEFVEWDVKDFFTLDDLHHCGQLACLPHHISTADEIKKLVNSVDALFEELPEPLIVTVATSRLDRYLPDSQAGPIHNFVETMLMSRYTTENVLRLDKPQFSVDCGESSEVKDKKGNPKSRYVCEILDE